MILSSRAKGKSSTESQWLPNNTKLVNLDNLARQKTLFVKLGEKERKLSKDLLVSDPMEGHLFVMGWTSIPSWRKPGVFQNLVYSLL